MNIRLHNKFEITLRGQTIIAYNTLLKGVFTKISRLEQYTSHIAIGTGKEKLDENAKKLSTYAKTFAAQTEEYNFDPTKGTLFIKKLVDIDDGYQGTFSFSELGLCATDDFDPDIYDHVLLTDKEGNVVTMTRREGDSLQIRVTIYLELTSQTSALFIRGNNKFIGRLLGENSGGENKLYAVKGNNLYENENIDRVTPDMTDAVMCNMALKQLQDGYEITFSAELGEGATEEIVMVFNGEACLRYNALELNPPKDVTETLTSTKSQIIELGKNVKEVTSLKKSGAAVENFFLTKYCKNLSDRIENPFGQTYSASTKRYVSPDGKMIAFIDSLVHLYKNENYTFKQLSATQIPASSIFDFFILDDVIVALYTTEPYIRIFDIVEGSAVERSVKLTNYNLTVYPYDWIEADCVKANNTIILGVIINNETQTPLVIRFTKGSGEEYNDRVERPRLTTAKHVFSVSKSAFSEAFIGLLTNEINSKTQYLVEEFYESTSKYGKDGQIVFSLMSGGTSFLAAGRALIAEKSIFPYLVVYYYPNLTSGGDELPHGEKHYFSKDGNYMIIKNSDSDYSIRNFHEEGEATEFEKGFLSVNFEEIKDFEFVFDMLLVFTSSKVYGLAMPKEYARIDFVDSANTDYEVSQKKYDLIGSGDLEGVKAILTLKFNNAVGTISTTSNAPISRIKKENVNISAFSSLGDVKL